MTVRRIVVGVDGSAGSAAALAWCAEMSPLLEAEVVAVHAVDFPVYAVPPLAFALPPVDESWRSALQHKLDTEWCTPLQEADVPFRTVLSEGSPAIVTLETAVHEHAALLVVGRRGHGGFAGLVLGSVADYVAHHATMPVVIVPVRAA